MTIVMDVRGMDDDRAGEALTRMSVATDEHIHVRADHGTYCPYSDPECAIGAQKTLTYLNANEVAAWCDGRRAGGIRELVGLPYPDTRYARPGDTIVRTGENTYDLISRGIDGRLAGGIEG